MATVARVRLTTRSVVVTLALIVALALISRIPDLLVELFLAFVIASALQPAVRHLVLRARWPRALSVVGVFAVTLFVIGMLGALVVPAFASQAGQLVEVLPKTAQGLNQNYDWLRAHGGFWRFLPPASRILSVASVDASKYVGQGLGIAERAFGTLSRIVMVLVVAFFVLLDAPRLRDGFARLIPPSHRALAIAQIDPVATKLGRYVQGTLLSMAFFILFQAIVLSLIHLPLALGVAVVAGILEVIPMLGTLAGLALGVLLAATISIKLVVLVIASMLVGRAIQDNLVNPFVLSSALELPPSLTIIALLVGIELLGLEGALIATPLLATIQVLVENLYVEPMIRRAIGDAAGDVVEEVPLRRLPSVRALFWRGAGERVTPPE